MDNAMGEKEDITIEQLRSSYAVRVAKKQIEAFKELDKQIKKMFDDIYEAILKEIQKCQSTNQSKK